MELGIEFVDHPFDTETRFLIVEMTAHLFESLGDLEILGRLLWLSRAPELCETRLDDLGNDRNRSNAVEGSSQGRPDTVGHGCEGLETNRGFRIERDCDPCGELLVLGDAAFLILADGLAQRLLA